MCKWDLLTLHPWAQQQCIPTTGHWWQSVLRTGKLRHSKRLCTLCNGSITNMGGSVPPTKKLVCKAIKLHSSEEAPVLCWMSSSLSEVLGQINKRGDWSCLDTAWWHQRWRAGRVPIPSQSPGMFQDDSCLKSLAPWYSKMVVNGLHEWVVQAGFVLKMRQC